MAHKYHAKVTVLLALAALTPGVAVEAQAQGNTGITAEHERVIDMFLQSGYKDQLKQYQAQCVAGNATSCGKAGDIFKNQMSGFDDLEQARDHYYAACDHEAWSYCNELGKIATRLKEYDYAYIVYDFGCTHGDAKACSNVAYSLYHGQGVKKDIKAARSYWDDVCTIDRLDAACHNYANVLQNGEGGPADPDRATALYARACNNGYRDSCAVLKQGR